MRDGTKAAPVMQTPLEIYNDRLDAGAIEPDPAQENAAVKLDVLYHFLQTYRPPRRGLWNRLAGLFTRPPDIPKGLYFHGGVGRGKSMLMDMFFDTAPVNRKRRVHFHAFMLEVHDFLHARRTARKRGEDDGHLGADLIRYADKVAAESWLLCFDEFHVNDVADAMILGRLFTALFDRGVVTVMTSNIAPEDLYKDGLQRDRFLPFIDLLRKKCEIVAFDGDTDFRMRRVREIGVYFWPLDQDSRQCLDKVFAEMRGHAEIEPVTLKIKGRKFEIPMAAKDAAWLTFTELCGEARGAADYLAIAERFHTVILEGIPKLTDELRNETRRFITLIDALYEQKTRLIATAEALPEKLYTGTENAQPFERTVSRMIEMQSKEYILD